MLYAAFRNPKTKPHPGSPPRTNSMTDDLATESSHVSSTISVLVIDDDPALVRMLKFVLTDHGFSVQTAAGGREATELFGREPLC